MLNSQALQLLQQYLARFAATDDFEEKIESIFGTRSGSLGIRRQWLSGDFSLIPEIRVLANGELGTANGAYAADLDEILVSADFLGRHQDDPVAISGLLLEEVGHKIDRVLNGSVDAPGDEGELFAAFVQGKSLSENDFQTIKAENDWTTISLDGKATEVEQRTFTVIDIAARGQGNDFVNVLSGRSYKVIGTSANNTVLVNSGEDLVYGRGGNDTIAGGLNDDQLYGGDGNDIVAGNDGNDVLDGGGGQDTLAGGRGNDIYRVSLGSNSAGTVINDLGSHSNPLGNVAGGGNDTLLIYQEAFQESPENEIYKTIESYQTVVPIIKDKLNKGVVGSQRDGTTLMIDLNKDGVIDKSQDLSILNFYNSDGSPGAGHIENILDNDDFDTSPFVFEVVNGKFEDTDGDGDYEAQGTILIGRKDGLDKILKIENAKAELSKTSFKITNGTAISLINNIPQPLFKGNFEIPFITGKSLSFQETSALQNDFKLGGLGINFTSLSIQPSSIELEGDFTLPEKEFLWSLSSTQGKVELKNQNALFIGQNGIGFGSETGKVPFPSASFALFPTNLLGLTDAKASIEYLSSEESLRVQGNFKLDAGLFTKGLELPIGTPSLAVDLNGNNYIQIKNGITDFNGEFVVNDFEIGKFKLGKLGIGIESEQGKVTKVTGTANIGFPFSNNKAFIPKGVNIDAGFLLAPRLELDNITINAINLDIPIYGALFLQDVKGGLKNLAPDNPASVSKLFGLGLSIGLKSLNILKINLEGEFNEDDTYLAGSAEIEGSIFKLKGNGEWNLKKGTTKAEGSLELSFSKLSLNGSAKYKSQDIEGNYTIDGNALVKFTDDLFLKGFKGQEIASAFYKRNYTNDNNPSNDYHLVWGKLPIPLPFFNEIYLSGGYQRFDDGKEKLIFSGKELEKIGSWFVETNTQWLIMTADWDNSTANQVQLRVKTSAGNFIEEKDFAANKIAVVNALSGSTAKTVIVDSPTTGIWDLEVINTSELGEIRYAGFRDSIAPTVAITAPSTDVNQDLVSIAYNAFDADSKAEISLFYDVDNQNYDGSLIVDKLVETDGSGQFLWNTQGIPIGDYYIYAMIQDENNAPVFSYSLGKVQVTEATDGNNTIFGLAGKDFNGDGKSDILWRNDYGSVALWQMDGATVTSRNLTSVPDLDPSWKAAGTGDFNGDGKFDVLWRNTNGSIAVWAMNGATVTSSTRTSTPSLDNSWSTAGTGDYNGDGKSDILWRNTNGAIAVWTMDGATVTSSSLTSTPSLNSTWKVAGNSDFNGDGKADILWRNDDGSVALWQMNGAAITASTAVAKVATDWKIAGTGDFNNDAKADILWRNDDGRVVLWQMNNTAITSSSLTSTPSRDSGQTIAGIDDYSGDGKSDILWRKDTGALEVWQMNGSTVVSSTLTSVAADSSFWRIAAPII